MANAQKTNTETERNI